MLKTQSLGVRTGGRELVRGLDFALAPGEFCALLGRNGAGKSSLLAVLAGLRVPASGSVTLEDTPLAAWPRRALARKLGFLPQQDSGEFWGDTLDYARLGRYPHSRNAWTRDPEASERARAALAALELDQHASQPYRTLSGGERQRARIAQLLVQDPEYLLLDEPLAHLDLRHQAQVMRTLGALAARGHAVIAALHEPAIAAAHCDRAVLLYDAGRAAVGRAADMLTRANLEALYRCRLEPAGSRDFIPT